MRLAALVWIAAATYAYGVFTGAIGRPGFLVSLLHSLFATLKAGYLQ
jgi:hypothetical protein